MKTIRVYSDQRRWATVVIFLTVFVLAALPGKLAGVCSAAGPVADGTAENEPIYGAQHMGDKEISAYRKQIRECRTAQERQEFRNRHRKQIQNRMQQRNRTATDGISQGAGNSGNGSWSMGTNTTSGKSRGGGGGSGWKKGGKR